MFYPTLIGAALILLYMHFVRSFLILRVGKKYRSRGGDIVTIVAKVTTGRTVAFLDMDNHRYYSNGERVDDTGIWNSGRLYETTP